MRGHEVLGHTCIGYFVDFDPFVEVIDDPTVIGEFHAVFDSGFGIPKLPETIFDPDRRRGRMDKLFHTNNNQRYILVVPSAKFLPSHLLSSFCIFKAFLCMLRNWIGEQAKGKQFDNASG